jgi:hypothetical protein
MTKLVLAAAFAGLVATAFAAPPPATFADEAKQADVMFLAKLVRVDRPPGFWSGGAMAIQTLTYDVTKVTKGAEKPTRVAVRYLIVGGAPYVAGKPEVADRLTKLGATYEVLEKEYPDAGRFAIDARPVP